MDIVVVATADWDNPLWTNKQHLSSRWGRAGHKVLYVESLGLRSPQMSRRDAGRVWRRLRRANRLRKVQDGVWVLSPLTLPFHQHGWARTANRAHLTWLIRRAIRKLGLAESVLWTYNPLVVEYLWGLPWRRTIYHCVDELAGSPGIPRRVVEDQERQLMQQADLTVVSSATLAEAKRPFPRRLEYLPNPADFQHFRQAGDPKLEVAPDLAEIPHPRIGFVGAVSDYKIDLEALRSILAQQTDWQLVMVGPVGEGEPSTSVERLSGLPNVHVLGIRSFHSLPSYIKGFDVCLLPNRLNRYTEHMFPLKFFEYLASGKPVVMSPLPALRDFWQLAYVALPSDGSAFTRCIKNALSEPLDAPIRKERTREASKHDWDHQARRLLELVTKLNEES